MITEGICKPRLCTFFVDGGDKIVTVGLDKHQKWTFEYFDKVNSKVLLSNRNVCIVIPLNKFEEEWEVVENEQNERNS